MLEVHSLKRPISEINGFRNCDECGFKSKSKHAFEVHLEERHGTITQGSPPLKRPRKVSFDLNKTQNSKDQSDDDSDMEEDILDDNVNEMVQMKENLKQLQTMVEDKNKQISNLEKETEELKGSKSYEINRRTELENELDYLTTKENDDISELKEHIIALETKLGDEKKRRSESDTNHKDIAIKNFKLEEENEALRMRGIKIHCNVCRIDFTPSEMKDHMHISQNLSPSDPQDPLLQDPQDTLLQEPQIQEPETQELLQDPTDPLNNENIDKMHSNVMKALVGAPREPMEEQQSQNIADIVTNKVAGFRSPQANTQQRETNVYCERCGKQFKNKNSPDEHRTNHK